MDCDQQSTSSEETKKQELEARSEGEQLQKNQGKNHVKLNQIVHARTWLCRGEGELQIT